MTRILFLLLILGDPPNTGTGAVPGGTVATPQSVVGIPPVAPPGEFWPIDGPPDETGVVEDFTGSFPDSEGPMLGLPGGEGVGDVQTPIDLSFLPDEFLINDVGFWKVSDEWATIGDNPALIEMPVNLEEPTLDGQVDMPAEEIVDVPQDTEGNIRFLSNDGDAPSVDDLALDWPVADIGPGVLSPQPGGIGQGGGGGGSGGGSQSPFGLFPPSGPNDPGGPGNGEVPEPLSLLVWLVAMTFVVYLARCRFQVRPTP